MAEESVRSVVASVPSEKDVILLREMASGATIRAAAEKAGLNYRTARRHLAKGLRAELDAWRRDVSVSLAAALADLADLAAEETEGMLRDPDTPPAVKRGLIADVFKAFSAIGLEQDNAERVAAIEERLGIDPRTHWRAA